MTGAPTRILLVAPTAELTDRARALGVETFVVTTKRRAGLEHIGHARMTLVVDDLSDDQVLPVVTAAHRLAPFSACVSLTEYGLEPAAAIAAALGIRGFDADAVRRTRDKALMREALARAGLSEVAAQECVSADEAHRFAKRHGYPVIVKPVDGVGSAMVRRVDGPDDMVLAFPDADAAPAPRFLVEQYLTGPEYSVECFTVDGAHTVLAVTEKHLIGGAEQAAYVELGHAVPAALAEPDRAAIVALTVEALTVLGVDGGPSHTEVKVTPSGPRIIETHTRVGGDYIPDLVQRVTGVDLYEQTVRWAAGLPMSLAAIPGGCGAAIRFFTPDPGVLTSVHGASLISNLPGVVRHELTVRSGDTVPPVRRSLDRSGYVLAVGEDGRAAMALCERAVGLVRFESDPAVVARRPLNA
ncbi:ATP-grasp domain-containing protein [Dactylosporangium fulvum]|uniref:ATP-grasp domain-containing protein n=1 Tax=Dactylosporangium fulvum TaxID=53359 RepID=UPI0031D03B31